MPLHILNLIFVLHRLKLMWSSRHQGQCSLTMKYLHHSLESSNSQPKGEVCHLTSYLWSYEIFAYELHVYLSSVYKYFNSIYCSYLKNLIHFQAVQEREQDVINQ